MLSTCMPHVIHIHVTFLCVASTEIVVAVIYWVPYDWVPYVKLSLLQQACLFISEGTNLQALNSALSIPRGEDLYGIYTAEG